MARSTPEALPSPAEPHPSDGELLVRHRRGDPAAFAELVRAYQRVVYGYLVRSGIEDAARDDLFQEIFTAIHRGSSSYQPDRPLKPWIFAIVANVVRSHYRKARGHGHTVAAAAHQPDRGTAADCATLAEGRETSAWIEQAIAALPASQREVVLLCCLEDLPQQDVAATLGMPLNTVKTHLRRGRLALARALARRTAEQEREGST